MYHAVDASMIRVSAFPLMPSPPAWPAIPTDGLLDAAACRAWIGSVWADDARATAVELASPVLADSVRRVLADKSLPSRTIRTAAALMRYVLRMQYRATPFGLFAGAAPLRLGPTARLRLGTDHRAFASADAEWLHDVITTLERDPHLLRHLQVMADPTCTVRGTRIDVPYQPGPDGPAETTLRRTRAAQKALALAQTPATAGDIVDKLHAEYPDAPLKTITAMVSDLIAHRVLLTSLRAPMTSEDALGHLLEQLDAACATPPPPAVCTLRRLHEILVQHDAAAPAAQRALRSQATAAMAELSGMAGGGLAVNLRPDCDVVLPEAVTQEAARALDTIARITPFPRGTSAWADYRVRFLERYSMGKIVPLRDLTDPDTGLGLPVSYRGTVLKRPVLATTARDEYLLTLAQNAALDRRMDVELTARDIEALTVDEPHQVPAHVELCFTVLAETPRDLDQGNFELSVAGLSLAAGTTTGRFLSTLDPSDRDRMTAAYAGLPTLTQGADRAQVSGPPLKVSTSNVSRAPAVVAHLLSVGEHNPTATLHLDDLGVIADAERLYLVALSTGQLLEPSVMNAVEVSNFTHPLIRFVCELHRSHSAILIPFAWGAASRLPFLPEIRVGRTILSPARWRLRAADLDASRSWMKALMDWRVRYGLPQAVYVGEDDRRLRLDLDVPAHQFLLHAELERHHTVVLHEAPCESQLGWIGRAHEVTAAFASDQSSPPPQCRPLAVHRRDSGRLPGGSERAYLKVYGSTDRAEEVLTYHLPRLLLGFGAEPPTMWFIRYADPDSHLRIRLHLDDADSFGEAAQLVAAWASELRCEGLIHRVQWDTDKPETGRYGTGARLDAAERYFEADSAAAIAQFRVALPANLRPAVTAASMVDIAVALLGSQQAGWRWLTKHISKDEGVALPRAVQALAVRLADPDTSAAVLREYPTGGHVAGMWALRRRVLREYGRALDIAGIDPASVLPSLLHMHHNRAAGINPAAEAACRRLARSASLSRTARTEGASR
ncbi:lantibiotic dehydratase [Streptomyces longwoodensis]|uniref:lantibiotic dehydratase n=1 Tax=Streptomyces longwoodensis TaxID=68231 RepID=UPI0034068575